MAITRFGLPQTVLKNEDFRQFCPTCRTWVLRDGWQGARNVPQFCSPECQRRFHQYTHPFNMRKLGGSFQLTGGRTITAGKTL